MNPAVFVSSIFGTIALVLNCDTYCKREKNRANSSLLLFGSLSIFANIRSKSGAGAPVCEIN